MTLAVNIAQIGSNNTTFRNRIINGAMVIAQRGTSAVTVNTAGGSTYYGVDRFFGQGQATDGVFTMQQSSTAPAGFSNSLAITVTTADAALGATQVYQVVQAIEAYNTNDLSWGTANAKTVTLSFQVQSSVTGTFGGALFNSAANRSYPFTYSISSANTWTFISVTIAGDTSGTWAGTNGVGIYVIFGLGVGSTYSGTAGAWAGTQYNSATGATNLMATNGATFYITGVQLEAGSTASPFENRQYGTELALCQRYYTVFAWESGSNWPSVGGYITNGGTVDASFTFPVQMRTTPTTTKNGTWNVSGNNGQPTVLGTTSSGFALRITGTAAGQGYAYGQSATNTVTNSAEL